jgi:hypothetical protein
MAIDRKYGRVTLEHGNIGEDEPVIVFRAKDALLPKVLSYYALFCLKAGSPRRHLTLILDSIDQVKEWQKTNGSKTPDSEASREWMDDPH